MLAVAPPRSTDHGDAAMENFGGDNFSDAFSGREDLLEDIDFDDIFVGFDDTAELPDLEMDPNDIFGEISSSQEQSVTTSSIDAKSGGEANREMEEEEEEEEDGAMTAPENSSIGVGEKDLEPNTGNSTKNSQGKKKVKVDWTPDLHRRFVQAVEQLGVEKAVPSKILEIMGIEGLTRHNIASHLQKYRSHRKHLLAREAEAATWGHRRRMYKGGGVTAPVKKGVAAPWPAATMGFPTPPPPMHHYPRPLHVWGHPTADHAIMHMWPRPMVAPRPALPPWDPSTFWHHYPRVHTGMPPVVPCLPPQPLPQPTRVAGKPAAGIPTPPPPPQAMYKQENVIPAAAKQLQIELIPSNECIDEALGDVLSNPWLPLPLGLKPPSMDGVMSELQKQGISRVPPSCV